MFLRLLLIQSRVNHSPQTTTVTILECCCTWYLLVLVSGETFRAQFSDRSIFRSSIEYQVQVETAVRVAQQVFLVVLSLI